MHQSNARETRLSHGCRPNMEVAPVVPSCLILAIPEELSKPCIHCVTADHIHLSQSPFLCKLPLRCASKPAFEVTAVVAQVVVANADLVYGHSWGLLQEGPGLQVSYSDITLLGHLARWWCGESPCLGRDRAAFLLIHTSPASIWQCQLLTH